MNEEILAELDKLLMKDKYFLECIRYMYWKYPEMDAVSNSKKLSENDLNLLREKAFIKKTDLLEVCNHTAINNFIEKAVELDLIVVIEGNKPQKYYNLGLTIRGVRAGYLVSQLELIFLDWEEYFVTRARLNTSFKRKIPISEACYNYGIIVSKEVPMPFPFDGDGLRITFDMDDMVLPDKNDASLKSNIDEMSLD